ncbi:hypothetical protein V5O48_007860 [Marasmius crinis-equi]|uniref:Uncharacterized protein n=1 Tax=Marasmius crinis-equi TaxID=585013 RepID=A0ABR3FFH2_9AGAR
MSLYINSPAASSTPSLASSVPTFTPKSILKMYAKSDFTTTPSGAVVPLPGSRHVHFATFTEQRGYKLSIQIDAAMPTEEVKVAKGHLEPRSGALPRRTRRKAQLQAPVPVEIKESKRFELCAEV